jgi:hypothetical protein
MLQLFLKAINGPKTKYKIYKEGNKLQEGFYRT